MKKLIFLFLTIFFFIGSASVNSSAQSKSLWVSPKTGVWQLVGKDEENTVWRARLIFTKKTYSKSNVRYKGYFIWSSSNGETIGREYFNGSFDKRTGRLKLKSYAVKSVSGALGIGDYVGFVSQKGRRISRGSWDGNNVVKGTWSANWLKFR